MSKASFSFVDNSNIKDVEAVAAEAKETAEDAKDVASDIAQHFWFNSTGDDTGAHISEQSKDAFESVPSGGNLLANSNGVAIRDGTAELATFMAGSSDFYDEYGKSVAHYGRVARIGKEDGNHILVTSADGINIYDDSDANIGSFEGDSIRIGAESTRHVEIKDGGLEVRSDANNTVGVFGYGSGKTASGTMDTKPYFTLGTRAANSVVGNYSFASGITNEASGYCAHAEGHNCIASGSRSHAEGISTKATNDGAHAEGYHTEATGSYSHAQGYYTSANGVYQFVTGIYNVKDTANKYYMIIGGGTSDTNRKNLFAVDNSGYVYVNGTQVHSSDRRLKEHLSYLDDDAIRFIDELKPAHYIKDGRKHVGFYAQDVENADEWDCMTGKDANGYMTLSYMEILAPLVAYVQRLEKRIEELEGGNTCT